MFDDQIYYFKKILHIYTKNFDHYENNINNLILNYLYNLLSFDFIKKKNFNKIKISRYPFLSEKFINTYPNYVDWDELSLYHNLPIRFINTFDDKLNWYLINKYQKLNYN